MTGQPTLLIRALGRSKRLGEVNKSRLNPNVKDV